MDIYNDDGDLSLGGIMDLVRDAEDMTSTSLFQYTKRTNINSRVFIDQSLAGNAIISPLMESLLNLYVGLVLTAVNISQYVYGAKRIRDMMTTVSTENNGIKFDGVFDLKASMESYFGFAVMKDPRFTPDQAAKFKEQVVDAFRNGDYGAVVDLLDSDRRAKKEEFTLDNGMEITAKDMHKLCENYLNGNYPPGSDDNPDNYVDSLIDSINDSSGSSSSSTSSGSTSSSSSGGSTSSSSSGSTSSSSSGSTSSSSSGGTSSSSSGSSSSSSSGGSSSSSGNSSSSSSGSKSSRNKASKSDKNLSQKERMDLLKELLKAYNKQPTTTSSSSRDDDGYRKLGTRDSVTYQGGNVVNPQPRDSVFPSGRIIDVTFGSVPNNRGRGGGQFHVTLLVQLHPSYVPESVSTQFIAMNFSPTIRQRWLQMNAGEISFFSDFLLAQDRRKARLKALRDDKTGHLQDMVERQQNNLANTWLKYATVTPQRQNLANTILIFEKNSFQHACSRAGLRFDNYSSRQRFFTKSFSMIVCVVDTMYDRVDVYYHSLASKSTFSLRDLTVKSRYEASDLMSIMKNYASNMAPKF